MIPLYLLLENFMSHARSELDFSQFDMALIIGMENDDPDSSNGIGKTALFDAVRWVLYGRCRFRTKKRVIKRGKVACSVTFVFRLQNETYKVVRKMSQRAASSEVSLLVQEGQGWRDLSCDTATATGEKIEELIKLSHDTFVNSIYFQQNELLQFAAATATQKKETLKESLHIEIWDRYQDKAKEIVRRLSAQVSALDDRIKSFGDLDRDMSVNKAAMEALEKRIVGAREQIAEETRELDKLRAEICGGTTERLAAIITRAVAIKDRKQAIVTELSGYKKLIEKGQEESEAMGERLVEASRQVLVVSGHPERGRAETVFKKLAAARKLPSYSVFPDRLEQDRAELRAQQRKTDDATMKLQQLMALEPSKKCPTCLSTLDDPDKVLRERKKRMKFLENTKKEAETLVAELARTVSRQEEISSKANSASARLEHMCLAFNELGLRLTNLASWCSGLEEELRALAKEWQELKDEKTRLKGSDDGETGRGKIDELSTSLEKVRQGLLEMSVEYGNLQGHAEDLERRLSERQTLQNQKPAVAKELDIHNQLVKAFGKGGVPAIIMENVTDDLRNYANEILKQVSDKPMSLDFVTQKRTESGSWTETFDIAVTVDDEVNEFEDLSGGEQVRVAMAVRLALSSVLMRRMGSNVKFLLLDEVDQALDRRGTQALADALAILSKEFKILVITHNDSMKERFDHIITVQKGPAGSFLRQ